MTLLDEPAYLWLLAAAVMLALEAIGMNGIGIVFGGIAAFFMGVLLEAGIIAKEAYIVQFAVWFVTTVAIAFLLYKPLKRWRTDPESKDQFNNIIGTTAKVASGGLMIGKPGKVHWSGTMMNAQIDPSSPKEAFLEGDMVQVHDVRGNQLLVVPHEIIVTSTIESDKGETLS